MDKSIFQSNGFFMLEEKNIRDLSADLLDEKCGVKVMPASYYEGTNKKERALFGHRYGVYGFVTTELVEWLRLAIGGRSVIEIGAGNGALAGALGIPATDSRIQEDPVVMEFYAAMNQPRVHYGDAVEKLDAALAVRKYRPQVVLASWVTHRYRKDRDEHGGNMFGVNEEDIIANCETYIFIGNMSTHIGKSIWDMPHEFFAPTWLYSRSMNDVGNFIAVWNRETHVSND